MAKDRPTVIVFAKAPKAGRVKSRLAADLGWHRAACLHRVITKRTLRRITAMAGVNRILAITPDSGWARRLGARDGWTVKGQSTGDLGRRMAAALQKAPPGPAILIGSDVPDAEQAPLKAALQALRHHDIVLGPAEDGGYWLIGARLSVRRHLPALLSNVRWSAAETLEDTCRNAQRLGLTVHLTWTLPDLDTAADLPRVGFSSYGPSSRARAGGA